MYTLSVIMAEDGSIRAAEPAPAEAISTITTPDGCEVYMPGDGQLLAERLAVQEQQ